MGTAFGALAGTKREHKAAYENAISRLISAYQEFTESSTSTMKRQAAVSVVFWHVHALVEYRYAISWGAMFLPAEQQHMYEEASSFLTYGV